MSPIQAIQALETIVDSVMDSLKVRFCVREPAKTKSKYNAMTHMQIMFQRHGFYPSDPTEKQFLSDAITKKDFHRSNSRISKRKAVHRRKRNVIDKIRRIARKHAKYYDLANELIAAKWGEWEPVRDYICELRSQTKAWNLDLDEEQFRQLQSLVDRANCHDRFFFHNHTVYDSHLVDPRMSRPRMAVGSSATTSR